MGGVTLNLFSLSTLMLTPGEGMGSGGSIEVGDAGDSQEGFPEASDMRGLGGCSSPLLPGSFYVGRKHLSDVSGGKLLGAMG
jgi:hypothetical protein